MPILLPADVLQPFDLRVVSDDVHAIAYIERHPVYESIEVMGARRAGGDRVRVILTLHDQTQIDCVGDDDLFAASAHSARRTARRDIAFEWRPDQRQPTVSVAFQSPDNEIIALEFVALSPASSERGGISDPGGHAPTSGFTLMKRRASTLAANTTRVTVDGAPFAVERGQPLGPNAFAGRGFYTEGHMLAIIRAGTHAMCCLERPSRFVAGEYWRIQVGDDERRYTIVENGDRGLVVAGRDDVVVGRMVADRFALSALRVSSADKSAVLSFPSDRAFALGFDDAPEIVTGATTIMEDAGSWSLTIRPQQPSWAGRRFLNTRIGGGMVATTCGLSEG